MNKKRFFSDFSIQTRFIILFILTTALIFVVNVYVYVNLNQMIGKIESIYASNVSLNELSTNLKDIHESITGYLKTKNTDDLESYYKYEQDYRNKLDSLNITSGNYEHKIMDI